jgi:hypothetical protein
MCFDALALPIELANLCRTICVMAGILTFEFLPRSILEYILHFFCENNMHTALNKKS